MENLFLKNFFIYMRPNAAHRKLFDFNFYFKRDLTIKYIYTRSLYRFQKKKKLHSTTVIVVSSNTHNIRVAAVSRRRGDTTRVNKIILEKKMYGKEKKKEYITRRKSRLFLLDKFSNRFFPSPFFLLRE